MRQSAYHVYTTFTKPYLVVEKIIFQHQTSSDDLAITKKIKAACQTVDIAFHDHLILTSTGYYSFADNGVL
jgi:hypothetical protein